MFKSMKELFKPRELSRKWFEVSSKEELMRVRNLLWEKMMNPNEDSKLRVQIRDYLLPLINRYLREKE